MDDFWSGIHVNWHRHSFLHGIVSYVKLTTFEAKACWVNLAKYFLVAMVLKDWHEYQHTQLFHFNYTARAYVEGQQNLFLSISDFGRDRSLMLFGFYRLCLRFFDSWRTLSLTRNLLPCGLNLSIVNEILVNIMACIVKSVVLVEWTLLRLFNELSPGTLLPLVVCDAPDAAELM